MSAQRTSISAKVIADSIYAGSRLTTMEVTFPRFILAEWNTHRVMSRNSASSRAIPVWKKLMEVLTQPFVPSAFGKNKSGMQSSEEVSEEDLIRAREIWLTGRDMALIQALQLAGGKDQIVMDSKENPDAISVCDQIHDLMQQYSGVLGRLKTLSSPVHKQHANRVLEPYSYHTVIVTASQWRNFYALRANEGAQPEIRETAIAMIKAHMVSTPNILDRFDWHLPFIFDEDLREEQDRLKLARISSARCARVSYLTHDGRRSLADDLKMAGGLQGNGHMSPFEHPAKAGDTIGVVRGRGGNFNDVWVQYRKMMEKESDFSQLISRDALLKGTKSVEGDEAMVDFILNLPG